MYDLLIRNGRVIDPSQELDGVMDIAFQDGCVKAISESINGDARDVVDASGLLVTPGLIDLHTHVYWGGTSIGVDPNLVSRQSSCTTLVDAGTAGAANFHGFKQHVIEPAEPTILAFLNVSFPGIFAFSRNVMVGECCDIRLLDARECARVIQENRETIVGVKCRVGQVASGHSGIGPLDVAIDVAEELGLPVMAHLDFPPPGRQEVLHRLRPGDILTHCFRPFPNAPVSRSSGKIFDDVYAARQRGVIFDVGHGMGSFGFGTAKSMLENDFLPDVISSDVHSLCINGPAFDLLVTMSKFLSIGMPLGEVIRSATRSPAAAVRRLDLGTLAPGSPGDASVLKLEQGEFEYSDVIAESIVGNQRLISRGRVIAGLRIDAE